MKRRTKKLIALSATAVMAASLFAGCGGSDAASSAASTAASAASEAAEAASSAASDAAAAASSAASDAAEAASSAASDAAAASSAASDAAAPAEDGTLGAGATASKEYKIAFCHQHMTNSFHIALAEGAEEQAAKLGVKVQAFDANQDAQVQISQIEQCVNEGYDAIIFEPVDPDGLVDAAKAAKEAGIVVLNISSTITGWEDIIDGYTAADNTEGGAMEMQHCADLLGGKGKIGILTGPTGDSGSILRETGMNNVLENYPDMSVEVTAAADWETGKAQAAVESWVTGFDLDAVVACNDGMAVGAGNAYGANSGVVIIGLDATDDGLEAIRDGRQTGTVAQDAGDQGRLVVQQAVDNLEGKATEKAYLVDNVWVDASNIDELYPQS